MQLAEAFVDIKGNMAPLTGHLQDAKRNTERAVGSMQTIMEKHGANIRRVGMGLTGFGAAIAGALGVAAKASINFNKEMANIATLIPRSTERVLELKSAIRTMAVEVNKSTDDLAQGAYQVISAFGDTSETVGILGAAAKAATAGVATTMEAIGLLSAVTKGYGDVSENAVKKVSDLSFMTVKLGQTTFPELGASIGKVTPLAAELGLSMEEMFSVMATGTGVTGTAFQVSTQLRGVLQSLMAPTDGMTKLIESLGYQSGKAMLKQLGMAETLKAIADEAKRTGKPLQDYIAQIEGQTLALALTGSQADVYTRKLADMRVAAGSTAEAFKEQTEGINEAGFAFGQAQKQIANLSTEIGDNLLPLLVPLVKQLRDVVGGVTKWTQEQPKLTAEIVKFAAVLSPMLVVGGSLVVLAPAIIRIAAAVRILTGALNPITAAITIFGTGAILTAKEIARENEAINRQKRALDKLGPALNVCTENALALGEAVKPTIGDLRDFDISTRELSKALDRNVEKTEDAAAVLKELGDIWYENTEKAAKLQGKLEEVTKSTEAAMTTTEAATTQAEDYKTALSSLFDPLNTLWEKLKDGNVYWREQFAAIKEVDKNLKALKSTVGEGTGFLPQVLPASWLAANQAYIKSLREGTKLGREQVDVIEDAAKARQELGKASDELFFEPGLAGGGEMMPALGAMDRVEIKPVFESEAVKKALLDAGYGPDGLPKTIKEGFDESFEEIGKAALDLSRVMEQAGQSIELAFSDLFTNVIMDIDNLGDAWNQFCNDMKLALSRAVADMIVQWGKMKILQQFGSVTGAGSKAALESAVEGGVMGGLFKALGLAGASLGSVLAAATAITVAGYGIYKAVEHFSDSADTIERAVSKAVGIPWWEETTRGGVRGGLRGEGTPVLSEESGRYQYRTTRKGAEKGTGKIIPDIRPARSPIVPRNLIEIPEMGLGGIVRRPTMAMLAESGQPEAVIPLPGGRLPQQITGGGDTYHINISIPNANLEDMDQARIERIFRQKFVPAIRKETRRGTFNSALV